jgi:hypothetical protein
VLADDSRVFSGGQVLSTSTSCRIRYNQQLRRYSRLGYVPINSHRTVLPPAWCADSSERRQTVCLDHRWICVGVARSGVRSPNTNRSEAEALAQDVLTR